MTSAEIQTEKQYRYNERLGIMTEGKRKPTGDEIAIAMAEAEQFEVEIKTQQCITT